MGLLLDPPIAAKVRKMRSCVRWGAQQVLDRRIDQTRLSIADGLAATSAFSFLVIGDTGFGPQPYGHPQRAVAQHLATQMGDCRFLLHTGDVVYQMGAPEQYPANFIAPYREWLVGGDRYEQLNYRHLLFRKPFLTVPGNHDYYNLPLPYGLMVAAAQPLRRLLGVPVTTNVSLQGSATGNTYARAFLDCLKAIPTNQLADHLECHYTTSTETGQALTYEPAQFTRLPNRYYQFRYGHIDFFALDSSTFNRPVAFDGARVLSGERSLAEGPLDLDWEQLLWLRDRLIHSCQNPEVRGRIVFLHHPPYVTESTKLHETACLSVRRHFRWVLDAVVERLGTATPQPVIDLVLSGHAHCFEYLKTMDTGHGDRYLNWIICGGSGARLRSQHAETGICEGSGTHQRIVAKSQLYIGRQGTGADTRWSYSFLRIDVQAGDRLQLVMRPFITELHQSDLTHWTFDPLMLSEEVTV